MKNKKQQPKVRNLEARNAWDRVGGPHQKRGDKRRRNERRAARQTLRQQGDLP